MCVYQESTTDSHGITLEIFLHVHVHVSSAYAVSKALIDRL